jgi:hypothetical protein
MRNEDDADLRFDMRGGAFEWWRFRFPAFTGQAHWTGKRLTLDNMEAEFYGGWAAGWGEFNFIPDKGADFRFGVAITNTSLPGFIAAVSSLTNNLDGQLSGSLLVTNANSENFKTWNGSGDAFLRDGLIWEIPVFGIFSPVLNGISPGLGNSRANSAAGTFTISNSVVRSDDLQIHASGMRLDYRGTVDFVGKVDAKVEARLLRDAWLVGPVVSTVFWPLTKAFEYKVTGTLTEPKPEPLYIPKVLLIPLHPFRSLKEMFPPVEPKPAPAEQDAKPPPNPKSP